MSTRFWLASAAMTASAIIGGFGLGVFATSPQKSVVSSEEWADASDEGSGAFAFAADTGDQQGPVEIRCTGCGPTLAERRRDAELAGMDADGMIDGSRDPEVRRYLAAEDTPLFIPADPPPPSPAHQLPSPVERFAMGDAATVRPASLPVAAAQAPPPVVATVPPQSR
ncbi:hypothetical protein [Sphingobium ummariense]|uniref:Uncharacterized protein n=1 Tax=Sphingobium ummariense RL-3 TaxID=1346791 RepID=T0KHU6_9SPHN|nr:hypothetical protein [Sphingobium ummariense]EQB32938.1 hypothetical protein M529_07060 [Sphingobium ummariense RL-3]